MSTNTQANAAAVSFLSLTLAGCAPHFQPGPPSRQSEAREELLAATPLSPPSTAGLPGPARLSGPGPSAPRHSRYIESDLIHDGEDFDPLLPLKNAEATLDASALLYPQSAPGEPANMAGSAYLTYRFEAPGYDRGGLVRLEWLDLSSPLDGWIGLSDWQLDRWVWFRCADSVQTGGLAPCFDAGGTLLLTVLVSNSVDDYKLRSVRLAAEPPLADFSVST